MQTFRHSLRLHLEQDGPLMADWEILLAENDGYFATPHFNGYPALLVDLQRVSVDDLEDLLLEAWLCQAPKRLASAHLAGIDS
jgi:hypothetical protein